MRKPLFFFNLTYLKRSHSTPNQPPLFYFFFKFNTIMHIHIFWIFCWSAWFFLQSLAASLLFPYPFSFQNKVHPLFQEADKATRWHRSGCWRRPRSTTGAPRMPTRPESLSRNTPRNWLTLSWPRWWAWRPWWPVRKLGFGHPYLYSIYFSLGFALVLSFILFVLKKLPLHQGS